MAEGVDLVPPTTSTIEMKPMLSSYNIAPAISTVAISPFLSTDDLAPNISTLETTLIYSEG